MSTATTADAKLDPYTAKAEGHEHTPQEKIDGASVPHQPRARLTHARCAGFKKIVKSVRTAMLVTRGKDGALHSRAMTPTQWESLRFWFVFNNASHKGVRRAPSPLHAEFSRTQDEIEADSHVNLSFYDPSTTNWASVSGKAVITNDPVRRQADAARVLTSRAGEDQGELVRVHEGLLREGRQPAPRQRERPARLAHRGCPAGRQ